jgi:trk system potassium uptake protein TrkH
VVIAVLGFIFLYFMSVVMLTFVMILSGLDFMSALGAVVASINNAGPGLNKVGPATNYAVLTDFQTWVCSFTMLLGRLEVLSLAVVFTRSSGESRNGLGWKWALHPTPQPSPKSG